MKVSYIALEPERYPRVRKLAYTLGKYTNADFCIMIPKFRVEIGKNRVARLFSAMINYMLISLQIFFVKADIFWVANCPDILALPPVLRKRKYILDYRSPWPFEVKREFGMGPWNLLSAMIESVALIHAEVITLTTSKLLIRVERFKKPVYVIPNYPTKHFRHTISREDFRRLHKIESDTKIVLFVGKLSYVEGADLMPDIISAVIKNAEMKVVFWIIGDGPFRALMDRVERKNPNAVKLFGWQPHDQIPNFINASDVCIVPRHESPHSHYYNEEGLQKISEYMLYKKPIIACGIAPSNEYLLVKKDQMVDGIIKALRGQVPLPTPRTWEEYCEGQVFEVTDLMT